METYFVRSGGCDEFVREAGFVTMALRVVIGTVDNLELRHNIHEGIQLSKL
jgi:hypothetical protein